MTTISKSLLNGLPIKKSRIQVFEILNQNPHGLSADSIYAQIKNEHKITLGTIYRILSEFENRKLVKRVFLGKSKSIYKLRKDKMSCNLISLKTAETSSFEHEKVNSRETTELIRSYYSIKDEKVRKRFADLLKSMAEQENSAA